MTTKTDVLILGAGVVGLTAALHLTQHGLKVIVLDKVAPNCTVPDVTFDARVFAVMPKIQRYFTQLCVWDEMRHRVSPYRTMHVWELMEDKGIRFSANDLGQTELGHIIEQSVLLSALLHACQRESGFSLQAPITTHQVHIDADRVELTTDQETYHARVIIGADGAQSWLRQTLGMDVVEWPYQQQAIIATIKTEKAHQSCARQRFAPNGPLAFLPLIEPHTSSIVWSQDLPEAQQLLALNEDEFKLALRNAMDCLGDVLTVSARVAYPLSMRHVKTYVQPRVALIGDAAHTLHPLAGLGMNLGLLDAKMLSECLLKSDNAKNDMGAYHHLRPYERARKGHNWAMIALMESFKRLFGAKATPIKQIRNWGLQRVDALQLVKNHMMNSFN